jgi:hypothetical protein
MVWYAAVAINIRYFYPIWLIICGAGTFLLRDIDFKKGKRTLFVVAILTIIAFVLIVRAEKHSFLPSFAKLSGSAKFFVR